MNIGNSGGIGGNLLSTIKKPEEQTTPKLKPPMPGRKAADMPDDGRPPMYVPTQRPTLIKRDSDGYQPTIIGRMNSMNGGNNRSMMGSTTSTSMSGQGPVIVKQNTANLPPAAAFQIKAPAQPEQ